MFASGKTVWSSPELSTETNFCVTYDGRICTLRGGVLAVYDVRESLVQHQVVHPNIACRSRLGARRSTL